MDASTAALEQWVDIYPAALTSASLSVRMNISLYVLTVVYFIRQILPHTNGLKTTLALKQMIITSIQSLRNRILHVCFGPRSYFVLI